jgi:membrane-associated phospholipid phosphatase
LIAKFSALDNKLTSVLRLDQDGKTLWRFAVFFAHSGDSWFWMIALAVAWLFSPPEWRYREMLMAIGIVCLALFVFGIKVLIRRRRPEGEFGAIYRKTDPHSFPSGHAARAAMLATLAVGLGPIGFAIIMVLWAPLVCLARVMTGLHYVSDVLAGILLGILSGMLILALQPSLQIFLPQLNIP